MFIGIETVTLFSESAKKLAQFYREVVGLKQTMEAEMGEKGLINVFGFDFKVGPGLYIIDHDKVKGKSKEPERVIFNLEVDDIEKEVKRLKEENVTLIADIYHIEEYGYVATFADVDGNYFQLVKVRA